MPHLTYKKLEPLSICPDAPILDIHDNEDTIVVKTKISKSKFAVYDIVDKIENINYAMKLFPWKNDDELHPRYINEKRFLSLSHENIIKAVKCKDLRLFDQRNDENPAISSYILYEMAPHGTFCRLCRIGAINSDIKLARTLFHKLISGIEYLHNRKVAHLDLKLENLLVGKDYELKICDFDCSFIDGDGLITTRGTKHYRPPELIG